MDAGHSQKELREVFGIYASEVCKWRKLLKETGSLEPRYKKERKSKIALDKLEKALEEKPDAYLSELAITFGCTKQAIFYALKRLKLTYKKNIYIRGKIRCEASCIFVDADYLCDVPKRNGSDLC